MVVAVVVAAWFAWPAFASGAQLDRTAQALALAGPAAAAAIAAAAGRPVLITAALAGAGGYVSGILSLHGLPVPLAVVVAAAGMAATGAGVAVLCARADGPAVLVITLTLAVTGGAIVQSLPGLTGAESGLGPLPPLGLPLGGNRTAVATPVGDFHVLLVVAALCAVVAALMLRRGPGPSWRAVGSDRLRAAGSRLSPLRAEAAALAFGGALAGVCGALAAHVGRVATPDSFTLDLAALPLLAALAAGREPLAAATVAVVTGLAGQVVLPAAGWQGPPDAMSLSLGVLAVAALFTLLPGPRGRTEPGDAAIDASAPWPLDALGLEGARLAVAPTSTRARGGELLLDAPGFTVEPGTVLAIVGPNGAGKTTLFRTIERRARRREAGVAMTGPGEPRLVYLPQEGGGFASCTVDETLTLAARPGRSAAQASALAAAWRARLGLDGAGGTYCEELSAGRRRLLDLARVLLGRPNVLVCDEPLAGLDDPGRAAAASCLRAAAAAGLAVLVSEHDRDTVGALAGATLELERPDWSVHPAAAEPVRL